jgi:hypothetical protein
VDNTDKLRTVHHLRSARPALVALAVLLAGGCTSTGRNPASRDTEQERIALCTRFEPGTEKPPAQPPVLRLLLRDGPNWLRVYRWQTSEPQIGVCQGGPDAWIVGFHTVMAEPDEAQPAADQLTFYGGVDAVVKARVLLGAVPPGATTIEARLPSGRTLAGQHDGVVFAVWAPGQEVEGAQVTAYDAGGKAVATGSAPQP